MSLYHLHVSVGKKSKGNSAVAKIEYINRESKREISGEQMDYIERLGKFDTGLPEVMFKRSGNMPEWASGDPKKYWIATDKFERKNGVLFISIEFALPQKMNERQREVLATKFADRVAKEDEGGRPYSLAIHRGKGHNPHCHLIVSERINDGVARTPKMWFSRAANKGKPRGSGGARKASTGNKFGDRKRWLAGIRKMWEALHNKALEIWKINAEPICCLSYEKQGIDLPPQVHLGRILWNKFMMADSDQISPEEIPEHLVQRLNKYLEIDAIRKEMERDLDKGEEEYCGPAPR